MADDGSSSPPLVPKGSYNIDWDNFDDSMDPFATKSKVVNDLPIATDDLEPLKVKKTAPKSSKTAPSKKKPVAKKAASKPSPVKQPVMSQAETENKNAADSDDPFKSSRALANSPTQADVDPFKASRALANSPTAHNDDADPFKPKRALANSPATVTSAAEAGDADSDPFKPSKALANSPQANRKSLSNDSAADVTSDGDAPEAKKNDKKSPLRFVFV